MEYNLDAPAIPSDDGSETSTEGSQPEQEVEGSEEGTTESEETSASQEAVVEEGRIPYSRFEKVNEAKIRAEAELELLRSQLAQKQDTQAKNYEGDLPEDWLELWGDSDVSRRAYAAEQRRIQRIEERAIQAAVENIQKSQIEASQKEEETVQMMIDAFTDFGAKNKRTFKDAEQSAILDIMDDLTPKDEGGKYIVNPITYLEKAVKYHDLEKEALTFKKRSARQNVASLTGADSEGEPSPQQTTTEGGWDSWRNSPLLPK